MLTSSTSLIGRRFEYMCVCVCVCEREVEAKPNVGDHRKQLTVVCKFEACRIVQEMESFFIS